MKTAKCIIFNKSFSEELNKFCEEHNFYRSNFIDTVISNDLKLINSMKIDSMVRKKSEKQRITITVDEDKYVQIAKPISPRLEKALKIVIEQYNEGCPRYKNI